MLKWLSEGSRLLAIAIVFATLATAQAQSNKPLTLNIAPDLSLVLQRGSELPSVVVTRDRLIAALEAATNGNHNERIYVRSAKGVRLEDLMAVATAAGSGGYKTAIVLQPEATCKSYLAMSEHDAKTFAGILKFDETLRHYCQEHPTYTLDDALIELRRFRYAQPVRIALSDFLAGSPAQADLARLISQIITANLKHSEKFTPIDQATFTEKITNFDVPPRFSDWRSIHADTLVTGRVTRQPDDRLKVEFRLWDVQANAQLTGQQYFSRPDNPRRLANIISDVIYERVTGEKGNFDASASP